MSELSPALVNSIRSVIDHARNHVYRMANTVLLESYWQIGRLIVESWTHYRLLCRIEDERKRNYYLENSIHCGWNSRVLQLFASQYLLYMPLESELRRIIEQGRERHAHQAKSSRR